ncbi:MAG: ABC transporter permease, partial [Actinomycetota bacterium]|nr:ABC transporter permease [Actinomycetota bacterium]
LRAIPPDSGNGDSNFALYLFSGLVPWALFAGMLNGSMQWLDAIAELRRKVFFPPQAAILGSGLALAVQSGIEMFVLLGALLLIGNVGATFVLYPLVLVATAAFGLGLGFVVAVLNTRLRDMQHLIGIGLNVLFFLTPIVYPPSMIPEESHGLPVRAIINANPIGHFVAAARDTAYLLQWPSASRIAWVVFYSVAALVGGSWFFSRRSMDLSEQL